MIFSRSLNVVLGLFSQKVICRNKVDVKSFSFTEKDDQIFADISLSGFAKIKAVGLYSREENEKDQKNAVAIANLTKLIVANPTGKKASRGRKSPNETEVDNVRINMTKVVSDKELMKNENAFYRIVLTIENQKDEKYEISTSDFQKKGSKLSIVESEDNEEGKSKVWYKNPVYIILTVIVIVLIVVGVVYKYQ